MDPKLVAKIKAAKSAKELSELAHKEGIRLSDDQAEHVYAEYHSGEEELSDAELSNVSGGSCQGAETLASKYKSVPSDGYCSLFEWRIYFHLEYEGKKKICDNCHYCITATDGYSDFCELKKAS